MAYRLHQGDCLEIMRAMPSDSVDSVVTDPPYGLSDHKPEDVAACLVAWLTGKEYKPKKTGFMGRSWDSWVPGPEVWREVFRVLKPGGHVVAFAGSRTHDLMSMAMRLAGFECRDTIMWVYGSGFPKSQNVGKAVGNVPLEALPEHVQTWSELKAFERQWEGWGTALKPAFEPALLFRKPLAKATVVENVMAYGTGGINVDGCRVDLNGDYKSKANGRPSQTGLPDNYDSAKANQPDTVGRWPANLIHDGSEEVRRCFPDAPGQQGDLKNHANCRQSPNGIFGGMRPALDHYARIETDKSAARFFYCAKASRADRNDGVYSSDVPAVARGATMREQEDADWRQRNGNFHPTVKPTDLMRYLCRLVTPPKRRVTNPDGSTAFYIPVIFDPFFGSGSTGKAAVLEGFEFVGCELDRDEHGNSLGYMDIAKARIEWALTHKDAEAAPSDESQPQLNGLEEAA